MTGFIATSVISQSRFSLQSGEQDDRLTLVHQSQHGQILNSKFITFRIGENFKVCNLQENNQVTFETDANDFITMPVLMDKRDKPFVQIQEDCTRTFFLGASQ